MRCKKIKGFYVKKAVSLPINMVVMLIIGIILFSLSLLIFQKFAMSSEHQMEDLNSQIQTNLDSLSCSNNEYVCSAKLSLRKGDVKTSNVVISNVGDQKRVFTLKFEDNVINAGAECGDVKILAPYSSLSSAEISGIELESGKSAKIPFSVNAKEVKKSGCTFVTKLTLKLSSGGAEYGKTPLIISVK